ncbi:class I SAM-dependent methyltransferase [Erythrobacter sp. HKB08]|uniref:class I SAM-dependent methyltransferase n=1 Tax=Erythrobacter sp. HKB08 TaxID=2502843 RepID=UPI001008CC20|nr:SAM-dependent methyltransferase [Erythrobacter sp. HKB08]
MNDPAATGLGERFHRLIRNTGPISLTHFMGESNAHYYNGRDPIGSPGDFVTAPEISQMFGELIGLWLADMWIRAGRDEPVHYVELGPGRGTLAKDALRTAARYGLEPRVHFVESSQALKDVQLLAVPGAIWHDDLSTVPTEGPVLIVANEFLDALPVRQLVRMENGWRERMVGLADDQLAFVAGGQSMDAAVPVEWRDAEVGTILETSPASAAIMFEVAGRLNDQGGAALFIDYGHAEMTPGSTLQAVREHRKVDPFAAPGEADLTALVDFATMARIAQSRGVRHLGTVTQGDWLRALGIETRAKNLADTAPQYREEIEIAMKRLTHPRQMGELFKVMGLAAPNWHGGAGFPASEG